MERSRCLPAPHPPSRIKLASHCCLPAGAAQPPPISLGARARAAAVLGRGRVAWLRLRAPAVPWPCPSGSILSGGDRSLTKWRRPAPCRACAWGESRSLRQERGLPASSEHINFLEKALTLLRWRNEVCFPIANCRQARLCHPHPLPEGAAKWRAGLQCWVGGSCGSSTVLRGRGVTFPTRRDCYCG